MKTMDEKSFPFIPKWLHSFNKNLIPIIDKSHFVNPKPHERQLIKNLLRYDHKKKIQSNIKEQVCAHLYKKPENHL